MKRITLFIIILAFTGTLSGCYTYIGMRPNNMHYYSYPSYMYYPPIYNWYWNYYNIVPHIRPYQMYVPVKPHKKSTMTTRKKSPIRNFGVTRTTSRHHTRSESTRVRIKTPTIRSRNDTRRSSRSR